jgi:hypothetical protein
LLCAQAGALATATISVALLIKRFMTSPFGS